MPSFGRSLVVLIALSCPESQQVNGPKATIHHLDRLTPSLRGDGMGTCLTINIRQPFALSMDSSRLQPLRLAKVRAPPSSDARLIALFVAAFRPARSSPVSIARV